jgi:hypothetical protein
MAKRNWKQICELKDSHTRLAISMTTDAELLACYERGFPHLFTEGDDEGPQYVPLSAIMEATQENEDPGFEEQNRHFCLILSRNCGNPYLHMPEAHKLGIGYDAGDIPKDILKQFVGQKAQAGLVVTYHGEKYLVIEIDFDGAVPEIGSTFTEPPRVYALTLTPLQLVALDK